MKKLLTIILAFTLVFSMLAISSGCEKASAKKSETPTIQDDNRHNDETLGNPTDPESNPTKIEPTGTQTPSEPHKDTITDPTTPETEPHTPADSSAFPTDHITRITFYGYYGDGTAANVPEESMIEVTNWLRSFVVGAPLEGLIPPGTNTYFVEIQYADGSILKSGLDTITIDGITYYTDYDPMPDCCWEIISQSNLPVA